MLTKGEIELLLDTLLKEAQRRRELGGYSVDAPVLRFIIESMSRLAMHVLYLEKQIAKLQKKPKK